MAYSEDWPDMSDYLVHFTKHYNGKSASENIMSILSERRIRARNAFGIARKDAPDKDSQRVVCFSEIPLHLLGRIVERRSEFGIGFRKSFLRTLGAVPVWCIENTSQAARAIQTLKFGCELDTEDSSRNPFWTITPFIDFTGKFPGGVKYQFDWEREWRKAGDLDFSVPHATFLLIPESLHDKARAFYTAARETNTGPSYECPFIDPHWDSARIRRAFDEHKIERG